MPVAKVAGSLDHRHHSRPHLPVVGRRAHQLENSAETGHGGLVDDEDKIWGQLVGGGLIFSDGFENGDISGWSD
jgi:hypothetical protein